jgi:hypothetical protein
MEVIEYQGVTVIIAAFALSVLAAPIPAPATAVVPLPAATAADAVAVAAAPVQVRVTARILVVERDAATRAGLAYVVLGHDRVRLGGHPASGGVLAPGSAGAVASAGVFGATAFLELLRERRLVRSESTQHVLVLSGGEARVASSQLAVDRHGVRIRGPAMAVVPTIAADGRVQLRVDARLEDTVSWWWGFGLDASPVAVDTELLARPGEAVIIAGGTVTERSRESGLLRRSSATHERDVLVVIEVEVLE